jgi:hypothetical protein
METFAGFGAHGCESAGSCSLETWALENTLFFYIVGDNGGASEGGPEGTYNG